MSDVKYGVELLFKYKDKLQQSKMLVTPLRNIPVYHRRVLLARIVVSTMSQDYSKPLVSIFPHLFIHLEQVGFIIHSSAVEEHVDVELFQG